MSGIVHEEIDKYIDRLANRGDAAVQAVERQGEADGWPIVGAAEGSLLFVLARSIGARRVLELGTAIGYSGTWLARALPVDGQLITVEGNPETAKLARGNLARTDVADRVTILVGKAEEVLEDLEGPFDLIFNDIDKAAYPEILEPCLERLRVGGLLVTDNVLWGGKVAKRDVTQETKAIRAYNEALAKDPRVVAAIVPLRDGVSIAVKVRP